MGFIVKCKECKNEQKFNKDDHFSSSIGISVEMKNVSYVQFVESR